MSLLDWFRGWLQEWRYRRCKVHNIIGPDCSRCGWPLRFFNVYLRPNHEGLTRRQKRRLRRRLSPPMIVIKQVNLEGCEQMQWATVGFDLTMEDHVWLTEELLGIRMLEAPR